MVGNFSLLVNGDGGILLLLLLLLLRPLLLFSPSPSWNGRDDSFESDLRCAAHRPEGPVDDAPSARKSSHDDKPRNKLSPDMEFPPDSSPLRASLMGGGNKDETLVDREGRCPEVDESDDPPLDLCPFPPLRFLLARLPVVLLAGYF